MSHPPPNAAAESKAGPAAPLHDPRSQRRPLQVSLLGLMVLMLCGSMVGAILFYFVRGWQSPEHKLVGMVFVLAGPLLLTVLVSLMVAIAQRFGRKS